MRNTDHVLVESLSAAFQSRDRPGLCTEAVLLRPLQAAALPVNELWRHGRVSKRAMKSLVNAAAKREMVAVDGDEVRLLSRLAPSEPASCPPLEALVSQLELEHPHFPVPYGTADGSFTGGPGVDWKPVRREDATSVESLPMSALLSQALVAFAIEYEAERRGPIQWAANLLRGVSDEAMDARSLRKRGIHSLPNLERTSLVKVDAAQVVRLTPIGRYVRDAYEPLCEEIESRWRDRFGSSLIDEVVDAVKVDGEWRPFPLVAWNGAEFALEPA